LSEKGLKGSLYGSANVPVELPQIIAMAGEGRINVADVVSHVTDLDGIEAAFERLRKGDGARTVVILDAAIAGSLEGITKA